MEEQSQFPSHVRPKRRGWVISYQNIWFVKPVEKEKEWEVDFQKKMFHFSIKGEAAQPEDSTSISSSSRTLGVHVPCQVLTQYIFFSQFGLGLCLLVDVHKFSCFRAVFKNEKISTVIHSKEVCQLSLFSNVWLFHNLICRWTNSNWPIATCWSPTWTGWSDKRSRRRRKLLSSRCASHQAPSLVPLLASVANVDVELSFSACSATFNCLPLRPALTLYQFWAVINPCQSAGCLNYPVFGPMVIHTRSLRTWSCDH